MADGSGSLLGPADMDAKSQHGPRLSIWVALFQSLSHTQAGGQTAAQLPTRVLACLQTQHQTSLFTLQMGPCSAPTGPGLSARGCLAHRPSRRQSNPEPRPGSLPVEPTF